MVADLGANPPCAGRLVRAAEFPFDLALVGVFPPGKQTKALKALWAILQGKCLSDSNRCFRHYARKQENPAGSGFLDDLVDAGERQPGSLGDGAEGRAIGLRLADRVVSCLGRKSRLAGGPSYLREAGGHLLGREVLGGAQCRPAESVVRAADDFPVPGVRAVDDLGSVDVAVVLASDPVPSSFGDGLLAGHVASGLCGGLHVCKYSELHRLVKGTAQEFTNRDRS